MDQTLQLPSPLVIFLVMCSLDRYLAGIIASFCIELQNSVPKMLFVACSMSCYSDTLIFLAVYDGWKEWLFSFVILIENADAPDSGGCFQTKRRIVFLVILELSWCKLNCKMFSAFVHLCKNCAQFTRGICRACCHICDESIRYVAALR